MLDYQTTVLVISNDKKIKDANAEKILYIKKRIQIRKCDQ